MPIDTSVKFIHSGMVGAPTLPYGPGNLLTVLRACLINGIAGPAITNVTVLNGIATVTCSSIHPFDEDAVATLVGADVAAINGDKKIISCTDFSYTFDATGVADQTITGTITHKVAPLGWSEPFTGTSTLAVFRSLDSSSPRPYLRVDDSVNYFSRVVGYGAMSDINTGISDQFPTTTQVAGGLYWSKWSSGSNSSPFWIVYGNAKTFYFFNMHISNYCTFVGFGDFKSNSVNVDNYNCFIGGAPVDQSQSSSETYAITRLSVTTNNIWVMRDIAGKKLSVQASIGAQMPMLLNSSSVLMSRDGVILQPDALRRLYTHIFNIGHNGYIRGSFSGMIGISNAVKNTFENLDLLPLSDSPSSKYRALKEPNSSTGNSSGNWIAALFDSTGPW